MKSSSHEKRFIFFLACDVLLIFLSLYISFLFHLDFDVSAVYLSLILEVLPFFLAIKLIFFGVFRIYRMTWRFVGIFDMANMVMALAVSGMALIVLSLPNSLLHVTLPLTGFPKRVILEDGIISAFLMFGLRMSKRIYLEVIQNRGLSSKRRNKTIIIGAGNTGEMVARNMARSNYSEFYPIGFLDDDRTKVGTSIHGVKVMGTLDGLKDIISAYHVNALIVAIPSLNHKLLKGIYETAKRLEVESVKIVPRIYNFDRPDVNLKALEDISIEDLVGRQAIAIDYKEIRCFLDGKSVFITGAGGSIGAEIASQVCAFEPASIILFDIDETELHNLGLRLSRVFPGLSGKIHYVTGDVRDELRLSEVFERFRPQIVFHAAAYKHVPMMESNPKEAVKVNMFGTYALARTAASFGVDKFIMISTDKAVMPTSVMGATKRMAENICRAHNRIPVSVTGFSGADGDREEAWGEMERGTEFVSVRFGNVLGSRGSVLPLFLEQLKHGGPLTVTHRDMRRYFMTIPEAVSLVLQSSVIGRGGEVLVLDMGEPVRIVEIAEELIRIHGLEPHKDIDIAFTGLRPGEKLFEEILTAEEGTVASRHEKVFVAKNSERLTLAEIEEILREFRTAVAQPSFGEDSGIKGLLKKYVKHYDESAKL